MIVWTPTVAHVRAKISRAAAVVRLFSEKTPAATPSTEIRAVPRAGLIGPTHDTDEQVQVNVAEA